MERYSVLKDKNPREIVLLRGSGCKWKRCTFCDYHLDYCLDEEDNYNLNAQVLSKVQVFIISWKLLIPVVFVT